VLRSCRKSHGLLLALALTLATLALGLAGTPAASADVCTGGAPYQASGSPPASLLEAAPFLQGSRWSKESLPQWYDNESFGQWGNQLAYAWYQRSVLWDASGSASWWVIPGQACSLAPGSESYDPQDCVMVAAQLALVSFDCRDPRELAGANPPMTVVHGAQLLVSGFASPGSGSVQVSFQNGSATFPAVGGVYGGSVSASVGAVVQATDLPAVLARPLATVALVDQTGLYSSSEGPLASTPRIKSVAATLHAHLRSLTATILGTAVTGHKAHNEVLYRPGARASARRVARVLHAPPPSALSGGALHMFGSVASVVVLVGRSN
jgi:hypothetical protein